MGSVDVDRLSSSDLDRRHRSVYDVAHLQSSRCTISCSRCQHGMIASTTAAPATPACRREPTPPPPKQSESIIELRAPWRLPNARAAPVDRTEPAAPLCASARSVPRHRRSDSRAASGDLRRLPSRPIGSTCSRHRRATRSIARLGPFAYRTPAMRYTITTWSSAIRRHPDHESRARTAYDLARYARIPTTCSR